MDRPAVLDERQPSTFTALAVTGLGAQNCIGTAASGLLQAGTCGGGGGSSSLEVMANGVRVTSPTASINLVGNNITSSVNGSTAIITFPFSTIATATSTLASNDLTNFAAVATSTAALWSQTSAVATSTTNIQTEIGNVADIHRRALVTTQHRSNGDYNAD